MQYLPILHDFNSYMQGQIDTVVWQLPHFCILSKACVTDSPDSAFPNMTHEGCDGLSFTLR